MIFALYIIVTLLICICLFLSQIVWQNETYHLENKYPNNKVMQKAIEERNEKMSSMVNSQFYANMFFSFLFSTAIFGILILLDNINFLTFF
ncbi:hypothetical protein OAO81_04965 [Candidatus Pelagibacter ubique]|jgi:hypothetical protein|nr:hypothetical protein [Candidatus Pelagibacter ubique]